MVDYNKFAKTFSSSRKNMKWEELDYFLDFIEKKKNISILDIWCGNWRLLSHLKDSNLNEIEYLWVDLSKWLLDEAKIIHIDSDFQKLNMINIDSIKKKFDVIFLIASYHHLNNLKDREDVLKKISNLLLDWWIVMMTNWALNSELNKERYSKSIIDWSKNTFWSLDYNIKIWEFVRYYHCFDLWELEYLSEKSWLTLVENKLFSNNRNFITILKKT